VASNQEFLHHDGSQELFGDIQTSKNWKLDYVEAGGKKGFEQDC
jgi:hypothetical protein